MPKVIPMIGKRFGRLVVISEIGKNEKGEYMWFCQCDCGNTTLGKGNLLRHGNKRSCGCLAKENGIKVGNRTRKHGMHGTRLYFIWQNMKNRCNKPTDSHFHNYGGRGISVCSEWENDFSKFSDWAIASGYTEELTIDRIDNNKGYSPDNCRWVSKAAQNRNKRNSILIEYEGKTQTLSEWAREKGIHKSTLVYRYHQGKTGNELFHKQNPDYSERS